MIFETSEGNIAHKLSGGLVSWGERNQHIFGVNWLREGSTYFLSTSWGWGEENRYVFLSPEVEGNVAHSLLGWQSQGKRNIHIFDVNWLREASKYFVFEVEGRDTNIFLGLVKLRGTNSISPKYLYCQSACERFFNRFASAPSLVLGTNFFTNDAVRCTWNPIACKFRKYAWSHLNLGMEQCFYHICKFLHKNPQKPNFTLSFSKRFALCTKLSKCFTTFHTQHSLIWRVSRIC